MADSKFNFQSPVQQLNEEEEQGITFEDKAQKWNDANDVKDIVVCLQQPNIVHYLKLEGNTLGVEAAEAIGEALKQHPELRKALWRNLFTGRLKSEIPQALKHLGDGLIVAKTRLVVLDLSDNALGPNGMEGLDELLRSPVCYSLQELRLNNCGLGIGGGQMLSKALLDCHRTSSAAGTPLRLKVLIAGRNRLENDGAKAIAKIFCTLKTLEEIFLQQNSIWHEGIAVLANAFKENPNLQVINLNDNVLKPEGAVSMADALEHLSNLHDINFGDCLLETDGAYHFAEALKRNHDKLEVVDLGFNEMGTDGALALIAALKNKPNLLRLNLNGNKFGCAGRNHISEAMFTCIKSNALESLDEDESDCDHEGGIFDNEEDDGDVEEIYDNDNQNDTTEEADEDEEYDEDNDDVEDAAYITTPSFTTKVFGANESFFSSKSNDDHSTVNENVKEATAELFCLSQKPYSLQMFESIKLEHKYNAFKFVINQFTGDNFLHLLIFTALKCAHLAQVSPIALQLAMTLFKDCFDYAAESKQERRVTNYILIQLGLLCSEDKFKSPYNLQSCRFALQETVDNQKFVSEFTKNILSTFLKHNAFSY